eukprot:TRINITY_DN24751_c0_g1_i1.p1 TRINITY_DN24751_c0_g1~~TRINITY_DN24751_c0_g1_i1.p1  ORF type:complete len:1116 (+),score=199.03 TRINITY_DN24751_c0_g1_i1:76-3423(+)
MLRVVESLRGSLCSGVTLAGRRIATRSRHTLAMNRVLRSVSLSCPQALRRAKRAAGQQAIRVRPSPPPRPPPLPPPLPPPPPPPLSAVPQSAATSSFPLPPELVAKTPASVSNATSSTSVKLGDAPAKQSRTAPVFAEHLSEQEVEDGLSRGVLVRGTLHVPSFHTDTAYVITDVRGESQAVVDAGSSDTLGENQNVEMQTIWIPVTGFVGRSRAFHGDTVVAMPMWKPSKASGNDKTGSVSPKGQIAAQTSSDADAEKTLSSNQVPSSQSVPPPPPPPLPTSSVDDSSASGITSTVDEVAMSGQDGSHASSDVGSPLLWKRARCRVVAVLERHASTKEFVALLQTSRDEEREENSDALLKVQPRDRRLPAFRVLVDDPVEEEASAVCPVAETSSSRKKKEARRAEAQQAAQDARARSLTAAALQQACVEARAAGSTGLLCVAAFEDWPRDSMLPRARVTEVLGAQGSAAAEADALLAFYGLDWRPFSAETEQRLRDAFPDGAQVVQEELARGRRRDCRHLRCISIDPPAARDLDDAVSVAPGAIEGTYRVGVHVADVTHFVRPGSAVDDEARRRATTVYLVGRVYPMLPRWLSENLCSLLPDGDRLAFSAFFTLDQAGALVDADPPEFQRTVIRTRARLDYDQVDAAFAPAASAGEAANGVPGELMEDLRTLASVTAARRQLRVGAGAMVLERSGLAFRTDEDGRVTDVVRESSSSTSHHLIEELMVLANHVVASRLVAAAGSAASSVAPEALAEEAAVPQALLRRHPDTQGKVREKVFDILPPDLQAQAPADADLSSLLRWCRERLPPEIHEAVCADVLTAFKEAEYVVVDADDNSFANGEDPQDAGSGCDTGEDEAEAEDNKHWALALPTYMHFTSPIRRYADILVHRRLAHILESEEGNRSVETSSASRDTGHRDFLEGLKEAISTCNTKKRDAQDAQMDCIQLALSDYVARKGGLEIPDAVITKILLADASPSPSKAVTSQSEDANSSRENASFWQRVKGRTMKDALEFYVPLAQCSRSLSFEALNIERVDSQQHDETSSSSSKGSEATTKPNAVSSVRVRRRDAGDDSEPVELRCLEAMPVQVISEAGEGSARRWTIRIPWAQQPTPGT